MANRTYLFACNQKPTGKPSPGRIIIGLSERSYDLPLVYRILVSDNPETCFSSIWTRPADPSVVPQHMAVLGESAAGLERLRAVFERITLPQAQALIGKSREFLDRADRKLGYYFLEAAELFATDEKPIPELNRQFVASLSSLDRQIDDAVAAINAGGDTAKEALRSFGLGCWSMILYYDIDEPRPADET